MLLMFMWYAFPLKGKMEEIEGKKIDDLHTQLKGMSMVKFSILFYCKCETSIECKGKKQWSTHITKGYDQVKSTI